MSEEKVFQSGLRLKEITTNKIRTYRDEKALLEKQKRINGVTNTVFANNGTAETEEKGDAVVEKVVVKDQEGTPIGYKARIAAGAPVTYTATLKAKEGKTLSAEELEKYKEKVKWLFWVGNTQVEATEEGEKGALRMRKLLGSSALEGENNKSFLNEEGKVTGDMLERCYLHYSVGSSEAGKKYTDVLTISWSKWLDEVERVRVEAYMEGGTPKKTSSGDATCSRIVQAQPEIVEAYWMNAGREKVGYAGYEQDLYLYINTLGLKGKTLEVQVHEKDFYKTPSLPIMFYIPNLRGDELIDWKNNSITIEKHDVIKQFKVGDRTRYENADKDVVEEEYKKTMDELIAEGTYTMLMCPEYKYTSNLQLYVHFPKQEHLKPNKDNQYAQLTLTDKAQICNAYFSIATQTSVQGDVPATKDSASPTTKVTHYPKLNKGVLGQTVHLVAACANLNGKKVAFEVFEKNPLLEAADTPLTLLYEDEPNNCIEVEVKDGFAVVEVKLQKGKEDADNKHWLEKLKNGYYDDDSKTAELYLKVVATQNTFTVRSSGEFLKGAPFTMIGNNWHEPVDDPQIAIYTQFGAENTNKNTFGTARGYTHAGLDIFALEGSNVYACLEGEVIEIQEWRRKTGKSGYGHNITLKVKNPQEVRNRRREYELTYDTDKKENTSFNPDSDTFLLRYAHLQDILVKKGQHVKSGEVIAKSGISGVIDGTKDPHLHFNIYSDEKKNPYLVNPAYYVYWKEKNDLTEKDKEIQNKRKDEGLKSDPAPKLSTIK